MGKNADPLGSRSWSGFSVAKTFIGTRFKNVEAVLKRLRSGLSINFCQLRIGIRTFSMQIRIRIPESQINKDPCVPGSGTLAIIEALTLPTIQMLRRKIMKTWKEAAITAVSALGGLCGGPESTTRNKGGLLYNFCSIGGWVQGPLSDNYAQNPGKKKNTGRVFTVHSLLFR